MDYRKRFFDLYVSTHTAHRDSTATLTQFKQRAAYFQQHWHRFVPQDPTASILDLGCGNGALLWWLQQSGYTNTEGIDVSAEQVAEATRCGVRNVVRADLHTHLHNRSNSYDCIIMRDVLEHFTKNEIMDILDLCFRSLCPGGRLIVQAPNAESPFFGRIRYGDFTHETAFCVTSLQQVLAVAGFSRIELHPTEPAVTGLRSRLRYLLWKLVAGVYQLLLFAELGSGRRIVTQGIIAVAMRDTRQ